MAKRNSLFKNIPKFLWKHRLVFLLLIVVGVIFYVKFGMKRENFGGHPPSKNSNGNSSELTWITREVGLTSGNGYGMVSNLSLIHI